MEMTSELKEKFSKIGKSNVRTSKCHERRIAKLLTEWSDRPFRRRRVEGRGNDIKVVEGMADVIPVEGETILIIEAKKGKDFSIDNLLGNPAGAVFTQWYHQASYDAQLLTDRTGIRRYPAVFFKPHPNWDWVAVPFELFLNNILKPRDGAHRRLKSEVWFPHIHFDAYSWLGPVSHNVSQSKINRKMEAIQLMPVIFSRWRDFSQFVDPNSIFI